MAEVSRELEDILEKVERWREAKQDTKQCLKAYRKEADYHCAARIDDEHRALLAVESALDAYIDKRIALTPRR